jgi:ribosomal protein L37AE/L43A
VSGAGLEPDADSGGERQVPFFCPYCGEEELRPSGSKPGGWECRSCSRGFQLRFAGLVGAPS